MLDQTHYLCLEIDQQNFLLACDCFAVLEKVEEVTQQVSGRISILNKADPFEEKRGPRIPFGQPQKK